MRSRIRIQEELKETRERLALYIKRERDMLGRGVQSYGIGTHNLKRYDTDLADIQAMIDRLENKIEELEAELNGQSARKAVGVVMRDW